jgi:intergrase/recombinase
VLFEWVRTIKQKIPEFAAFMDFITVTGLRFEEALHAYNLFVELTRSGRLDEYYNAEQHILEHFRFKNLFLRKTKKAFMSYVPKELIEEIGSKGSPLTRDMIIKRIQRLRLKQRFADLREFHASYSTKYLRQPEIDFIQGRVSASVFMRNYFNPMWIVDLKDRTLKNANELLELTEPR